MDLLELNLDLLEKYKYLKLTFYFFMDELLDMLAADGSAADISDQIKQSLFSKSAEKINELRPYVAASMFNLDQQEEE